MGKRGAKAWLKSVAKPKEEGKAEESDGELEVHENQGSSGAVQCRLQDNREYILIITTVIKKNISIGCGEVMLCIFYNSITQQK